MTAELTITPIGYCHCLEKYPYDAPRQGVLAGENCAVITLLPDFAPGLQDLEGFSHLWLIFWFDRNHDWHNLVRPPRHQKQKVGVFASRSPYRPNPLGLSCVKLLAVKKNKIYIAAHDLLDGTPILDIKPYLPYADAFPQALPGWTAAGEQHTWDINFSTLADAQLAWLDKMQVHCLRGYILDKLNAEPLNKRRHRLLNCRDDGATLAYRTWRAEFLLQGDKILVQKITSGYTDADLQNQEDKYQDKDLHRLFLTQNWDEYQ